MPHLVSARFFRDGGLRTVRQTLVHAALAFALLGCDGAPRGVPSAGLTVATVNEAVAGSDSSTRPSFSTIAERSLRLSRAVLLGSRDPAAESCVKPVLTGSVADQVPPDMGDIDGGPGTRLATLLFVGRESVATAAEDLTWHQTRLRAFLENQRAVNVPAYEAAQAFHAAAKALSERAAAATAFPDDLAAPGCGDETTWPGWCLRRIDEAVQSRNLDELRRWTAELEGAAFWLTDLHRWLDFLSANFLAALDFQRHAPEAFQRVDRDGGRYAILSAPSCLPAGMLTQHGRANFLEIERQAERMFTMPPDRIMELRRDRHLSPESMLVPPARRRAFLAYLDVLSPSNRQALMRAARTPYEGCYLVNMLFRADTAEVVEQQCEVLRRFDGLCPEATVEQLMGVLFYRGHSFSALEWADRFSADLLAEAALLGGSPAEAFFAACRRAHEAFTQTGRYGLTLTLRDSLAKGMFDCVRATDLAVTLFRNSGRSGVGHVRWSAGTEGHSVAAFWGDGSEVLVTDPLAPGDAPATFPDGYFGGATWPEMLRDNAKPYAAELYARGLDNYVWVAGYVIRGARAGSLVTTSIPYLAAFRESAERRVFSGPYPDF